MIIKLSPQIREANKIWYEITENKVEATINDISDTFDFTDLPDGELELIDGEFNSLIETDLDEVPILSAKKEDGVLTVEILFTIDIYEEDERLIFPEPMSLEEFNDLMKEMEVESDGEDDLEGQ